jgi:integrase
VAWTLDEISRIWDVVDRLPGCWGDCPVGLGWRIGLNVFWDTGCRLGEQLAAKLSNIWWDDNALFVPASDRKGKREDKLYRLHPDTMDWIRRPLPSDRELLFPFPWKRRQIWGHYKVILHAAGLPFDRDRMFHCIRRTVESYAAAARGVQWAADAIAAAWPISAGPIALEAPTRRQSGQRTSSALRPQETAGDPAIPAKTPAFLRIPR